MRTKIPFLTAAIVLALGASAGANAASDAVKCTTAKLKTTAKHAACRLQADATAESSGKPVSYAKCDTKQAAGFAKADDAYGAACLTTGDQATAQTDVNDFTTCLVDRLTGAPRDCDLASATLCGNGVVDPGEVCDPGNLGGATCATATSGAKKKGTLRCGAGCTSFDVSSCQACAADGAIVNGACWVLGTAGASCDAACAAASLFYDGQTEGYAGSFGELARCGQVLTALGYEADSMSNQGPPGVGCFLSGTVFIRERMTPTTAAASFAGVRRACACS